MRKGGRFLTCVLGVLGLLIALSPWLLYELGLSRFDAMPTRPTHLATAEQQAWVWALARGSAQPRLEPMNPYVFVQRFLSGDGRSTPSESLAYWVSREYVWQLPRKSMGWWHLTNAALTIWLTRHWTAEEIASAAYVIASKWPQRKPHPINPGS